MSESLHAFALFFSLLNPFLMSIYMLGIIRNSEKYCMSVLNPSRFLAESFFW